MKIFTNKAALVAATLTAGQLVETKGYTTAGDGGGARYLIQTAAEFGGTPDEKNDLTLANGSVAKDLRQQTATTVQLADVADAINTGRKTTGQAVFNTTTSKLVVSAGETAAALWVNSGTGATEHTPA